MIWVNIIDDSCKLNAYSKKSSGDQNVQTPMKS